MDRAVTTPITGPAARPCPSCPYRRDVPSGIWHPTQYQRLPAYDRDTGMQPLAVFLCHQTPADNPHSRLCAGWVGCHGDQLLALRIAAAQGRLAPGVSGYRSPVPLWPSGSAACEHGMRDIDHPSGEAAAGRARVVGVSSDPILTKSE